MNDTLTRILGGSPGSVLIRLIFLSLIVGVIMAATGVTPENVIDQAVAFVRGIWNLGFGAIEQVWRYFLLGAVVVVPIWIVLRVLKVGSGKS